jgi:hypothetical protein
MMKVNLDLKYKKDGEKLEEGSGRLEVGDQKSGARSQK